MSAETFVQPRMERPTPEAQVSARVLKDFYFSFRFSQGTNELQWMYFGYLNWYYRTQLSTEDIDLLNQCLANDSLRERAAKFRLPSNHKHVGDNAESMFTAMFQKFETALAEANPTTISDEQVVAIVDKIAQDDYRYQAEFQPRPNTSGSVEFDPHHSLLREFILKGQPTGSEAYDALFATIANRMGENLETFQHDKSMLPFLPKWWENTHPGESFYPHLVDQVIQPTT